MRSDTARIFWQTLKWSPYHGTRKSKSLVKPGVLLLGRDVLTLAHDMFSLSPCFLHSEVTCLQTRWCTWLTWASAMGRGPSISKPGPFYAACATCQVMNCSCFCLPTQSCEIRVLTVLSSVLCQSSASVRYGAGAPQRDTVCSVLIKPHYS